MRPSGTPTLLLVVLLAAACTPARNSGQTDEAAPPTSARPLSIIVKVEPPAISESTSGVTMNYVGIALFTATLTGTDSQEVPYPVLAAALPELGTDSWRVSPDGRMETVYRLKPGLTWHDGAALSAEDFVFGHQARTKRIQWGLSNPSAEVRSTDEVVVTDPSTVVIRWNQPYAEAATSGPTPLPRHVLGPVLDQGSPEVFSSHPYWTTDYIGAGPFRLEQWQAGAFIEGAAFGGYALGRPRIDRVVVTWSSDPNVALSQLLSGAVDIAADTALQFQQALVLRRQWVPENRGVAVLSPTQLRYLIVQQRPEYADPQSLLDIRVRKAVFHSIDRPALAEAMLEGEGRVAEAMIPPTAGFYELVDRAIAKYPYDARRAEELMLEAGFTKASDGAYSSPSAGRFSPGVRGLAEGQEAQETTIVVDNLKRAGMDVNLDLIPSAQYRQNRGEQLSIFPALRVTYATFSGDYGLDKFTTANIATRERGWAGSNRTGWSNESYDRLQENLVKELRLAERHRLMAEMAKALSEGLPAMPTYFNFAVVAHAAGLHGPGVAAPRTTVHGNLHEWEWR